MIFDVFHIDICKAHGIFEVRCSIKIMIPRNMLYTYGVDFPLMIFLLFYINCCEEAHTWNLQR